MTRIKNKKKSLLLFFSAGIGRSGTYISVDYLLQQARVEGQIDLLHFSQLMRSFRVNMIQTWVSDSSLLATRQLNYGICCNLIISNDYCFNNSISDV